MKKANVNKTLTTFHDAQNADPPPHFVCGPLLDSRLLQRIRTFILQQKKHAWIEDEQATRSTINYGWDYPEMEKGFFNFIAIPPLILELRESLVQTFQKNISKNIQSQDIDNVIITIYEEGQFIIPHYDADNSPTPLTKRSFYFEEPILGVVIEEDPNTGFTFYRHEGTGRPTFASTPIFQVKETAGSTFLIQGPCRHAPYFHAIPPTTKRRISVTMRRTIVPEHLLEKK